MPRLVAEYGQARAEWMMHRLRNLNLYPSLFVIDQISSQLRIVRPLAWNRTEIVSQCIGVKGESDADRENRIRQFEDFFNVSGMGTPDDLVEFREAQRGFQARLSAGATSPAATASGSKARRRTARRWVSRRC